MAESISSSKPWFYSPRFADPSLLIQCASLAPLVVFIVLFPCATFPRFLFSCVFIVCSFLPELLAFVSLLWLVSHSSAFSPIFLVCYMSLSLFCGAPLLCLLMALIGLSVFSLYLIARGRWRGEIGAGVDKLHLSGSSAWCFAVGPRSQIFVTR